MNKGRGVKKDFQQQFRELFGKDITEFGRFKDVLSQLSTETTRRRYINELPRFFISIRKNPDQVIAERVAHIEANKPIEVDQYEKLVKTQINAMIAEGYAPNTIKTYLSRIMGFFSNTSKRIALDLKISRFNIPEGAVVKKHKVTNEETRYIYKIASAGSNTSRNMSILCFAYQNGLDPIDIANLKIEDILDEAGQVKAWQYYKKPRSKTGRLWHSALTPEQAHNIEDYLALRGNPTKGKLFTGRKGDLNEIAIEEILRTLVKNARLKRIRPKDFRDAFKDELVNAKVDVETSESLMGHSGAVRHRYDTSENLEVRVVEAMKKAYQFLKLNDVVLPSSKTYSQRMEELEERIRKQDEIIKAQEKTIEHLATKQRSHDSDLTKLKKDFDRVRFTLPQDIEKDILEKIVNLVNQKRDFKRGKVET